MAYQLEYTGAEVDRRLGLAGNIPTKVSDLTNDSGFITKSVNDLVNYYLKSETYTKAQVESLIAAISQFRYVVVSTLPTASADTMNKIYLVPSDNPETQNVKDEYITLENDGVYTWEQIGSTAIDLSDYVTETQLNTALAGYVQKLTSVPEGNIVVSDSNGGIKNGGVGVAELKDVIAGNGIAAHLVDTQSAGTEQNFTFRQSGGDGVANYKTIKGRTLVWNQIIPTIASSWTAAYGRPITLGTNSMKCEWSGSTMDANDLYVVVPITYKLLAAHKYYIAADMVIEGNTNAVTFSISYGGEINAEGRISSSGKETSGRVSNIVQPQVDNTLTRLYFNFSNANAANISSGTKVTFSNVQICDLTDLFDAGNEPATVDEFTALFRESYYANNAGTLLPFKGEGLMTDGFNHWDEVFTSTGFINDSGVIITGYGTRIASTNYIPVIQNTMYYFRMGYHVPTYGVRIAWYDSNKQLISVQEKYSPSQTSPANAAYMRFNTATQYGSSTYKNDICVSISNAARNGEYEPHWASTLNLPIIGKTAKDSGGNPIVPFPTGMYGKVVYDEANRTGGVKRREQIDIGTLTWAKGTNVNPNNNLHAFYAVLGPHKAIDVSQVPDDVLQSYEFVTNNDRGNYTHCAFYNTANPITLYIFDSSKDNLTAEEFKAAVDGIYLDYELLTPVPFTWDEPLGTYIPVDELGTEKLLPEGVDTNGVPKTAPFRADTTYSISIANLVRKLNALSNE